MTADLVQVQRLVSSVTMLFKADQRPPAALFRHAHAQAFAKRMEMREVAYAPGEGRPGWIGRKGVASLSPSRRVAIEEMFGNENELMVSVEGVTADALDVLREIWAVLCELIGQDVDDISALGSYTYLTTGVLKLPNTFEEMVPAAALLRRETTARLGPLGVETRSALYRVSAKVHLTIGSALVEREVIVEPRFTSVSEDRVFFTVSPLNSEDHLAMCEALCRSVAG